MKNRLRLGKGFTLIELMMVLAIIGILAAIIIGALNSSREKAQEKKMLQEIGELRKALELYYDKHGQYPSTGGAYTCTAGTGSNACTPGTGVLQVLVTEGFLPSIPVAPGADGNGVDPTEIYYGAPGWWNASWGYQIQFQVTKRDDALGECYLACPNVNWAGYYSYSAHP